MSNASRRPDKDWTTLTNPFLSEFWNLGHRLFRTTQETYPVPFVQGDIFDKNYINPAPPCYEVPATPRPDLQSLPSKKSLTPLQGHVSAIHVSSFFHLFQKDEQVYAAKALASLLSPTPGSMIFGRHSSTDDNTSSKAMTISANRKMYGFNTEDWTRLWNGEIFKEGTVRVDAELRYNPRRMAYGDSAATTELEIESRRQSLIWCVTRL